MLRLRRRGCFRGGAGCSAAGAVAFGQKAFATTRDGVALIRALGCIGAGTLTSVVGEAVVAPPGEPGSSIALPAPLIGVVWTALFACFGVARARLRGLPKERRLVDALWLMCVTNPLHTDGIRSRAAAYAGERGDRGADAARLGGRMRRRSYCRRTAGAASGGGDSNADAADGEAGPVTKDLGCAPACGRLGPRILIRIFYLR